MASGGRSSGQPPTAPTQTRRVTRSMTSSGAHPSVSQPPADATYSARLTYELKHGLYDCSVCLSAIVPKDSIYSCSTCYAIYHLSCISDWAKRSVDELRERAKLHFQQGHTLPQIVWRCPGCQTVKKENEIPKKYTCFCGRHREPKSHSCGMQCKKPRPPGCQHPCGSLCHPGPCDLCSAVETLVCWCGKENRTVRCSQLRPKQDDESILSCSKPCGKQLACGMHRCQRACHSGECGACEEEREKRCYCGVTVVRESCGRQRNVRQTCHSPRGNDNWDGEFSCGMDCKWCASEIY
jgi:transcriptional repressor NF-X1